MPERRGVLLTGATGLLGQYLLSDLLLSSHPVAVLVRDLRQGDAAERIARIVAFWSERLGLRLPTPTVISGDLGQVALGLTAADRHWLGRSCRAVIHSAANLSFRTTSDGEPWRTNILGTQALLALCRDVGLSEWHQVSTAFVCGRRAGLIAEEDHDNCQGFHNPYEESKWRSEQLVREAAGTSGAPCATAYRDDEFQAAFVTPFLRVAAATGFPRAEPWLWVGPSGPHIIGKVVRELARQTGSMDPFSVDFDPRWAKRLADGFARQRYLDHVTDQALDVLRREEVGVLFITPPALAALAARLSDSQREAIHGIHYGGMSLTPETVNDFRAAFPRAVHLAGYGNTLFGVVMEMADAHRLAMDYFPLGDRVRFHVVDWADDDQSPGNWPPRLREPGQSGRVLFHRLDESCLLVGVLERDQAEPVLASPEARALGGHADGLRNPQAPPTLVGRLQMGLY